MGSWFPWIILGVIAFVVFQFITIDFAVSQGSFRGKVIDAEYAGILWKNYIFHVPRTQMQNFDFTICNDLENKTELFEKVLDAQKTGKEIIISYQDRFWYWNWECNGASTPVTDIQIAE